jgi:hypothetical protein
VNGLALNGEKKPVGELRLPNDPSRNVAMTSGGRNRCTNRVSTLGSGTLTPKRGRDVRSGVARRSMQGGCPDKGREETERGWEQAEDISALLPSLVR